MVVTGMSLTCSDSSSCDYLSLTQIEPNSDFELEIFPTRSDSLSDLSYNMKSDAVAKKRRIRNRRVPLPKIVKTDIRRHYGTMMANVLNTHSISLLQSFFATYCTHHLSVEKQYSELTKKPHVDQHLFTSTTGILLLAAVGMQLTPDETFSLKKYKVITRSDSDETTILLKFSACRTLLYDVDIDALVNDMVGSVFKLRVPSSAAESTGEDDSASLSEDLLRSSLGDIVSVVTTPKQSLNTPEIKTTDSAASTIYHTSSIVPPAPSMKEEELGNGNRNHQRSSAPVVRVLTPAQHGTPVRLPNAFAFYQAKTGKCIPLRSSPEQVQVHSQVMLLVNSKRQIVRISVGQIFDESH